MPSQSKKIRDLIIMVRKELGDEQAKVIAEQMPSGHIRIILPNGKKITVANTPSDHRNLLNFRTRLRRKLRDEN